MTEQEYYKKYWEFREITIDKMKTLEKYKDYQNTHIGVRFDNIKSLEREVLLRLKKINEANKYFFKDTKK